jgi:acetoin utilization deacetylase AcuC-like enzyme
MRWIARITPQKLMPYCVRKINSGSALRESRPKATTARYNLSRCVIWDDPSWRTSGFEPSRLSYRRRTRSDCMTWLYFDPICLEHDTGRHPENATRLRQIWRQLERVGLTQACRRPTWAPATLAELARVHNAEYLAATEQFITAGGGRIEEDTVCSPRSWDAARQSAGAVCDAVRKVIAGSDKHALCLVRPPGHHALADAAMGFCLVNNIAVGTRTAIDELGLERVLIVDWDVHHGNGTQAIFWDDPQVGFLSIHRWPFYPGTGTAAETGTGSALGTKLNLPIEMGISRRDYLDQFKSGLARLSARMRPQLVLISAGFDSHRDDPIGSLGLEVEDFAELTAAVIGTADEYAGGRLVSVLEGGYNPPILAGCVELHLNGLLQ